MRQAVATTATATAAPMIVGRIHRSGRGDVFLVTSRSQVGMVYRVEVLRARLSCPCKASVYTGACAHRRVVHAVLAAEAEEDASQLAHAPPPVPPRRETRLNRSKPFSLMR